MVNFALQSFDKRVITRLEQFGNRSSWTVHDRPLLALKSDGFYSYGQTQPVNEQWEHVAMCAGVTATWARTYDYLLDAGSRLRLSPIQAVSAIARDDYKKCKLGSAFRILLFGGPADLCLLRLAVKVSKLSRLPSLVSRLTGDGRRIAHDGR